MSILKITVSGRTYSAETLTPEKISLDGIELPVRISQKNLIHRVHCGDTVTNVYYRRTGEGHSEIWINDYLINVTVEDRRSEIFKKFKANTRQTVSSFVVNAPMPGLVVKVEVNVGDRVPAGAGLVVLEAMKMENEIRSEIAGVVKSVHVEKKMTVEKGQRLITIEPENIVNTNKR